MYAGQTITNTIKAFGNRLFTRYDLGLEDILPFGNLFVHAEHELLRYKFSTTTIETDQTKWFQSAFVGGGVMQPLGGRASLNIYVLYNLLYDQESLYNSPWVYRVGVTF